jgi:hypothetical protein
MMDMRQATPRIVYIATWTILIGVLGTLFWLTSAPPAALAHFQPWFKAAADFVFGGIFLACGLLYHSWFARVIGAHNAPLILHFGPARARIGFCIAGVIFLVLGVTGILLHWG